MHDPDSFSFHTPIPIEFGVGVAARVGQRAAALGMRHALLVADQGIAQAQACHEAAASLATAGVAATLFADVVLEPTAASIGAAAAAYRASGADGLVALGGGSAMDTAKALGVLAVSGGDDILPYTSGGEQVRGIPPLICMPTTAGTGAEVTFIAMITHQERKLLVRDPLLAPALALVDPALTVNMPPRLTAATGMDALAHSVEALTSTMANPVSDTLALEAIRRIGRWLPRAVERGDDLAPRRELSLAALVAGMAFLNGHVHLGHAVGHSLGSHYGIPHGFACAMCLPALMRYLQPVRELALARIGGALNDEDAAAAIARLMIEVGAPNLGDAAGVTADDIPRLVQMVLSEERLISLSPRQPQPPDWAEIFAESL